MRVLIVYAISQKGMILPANSVVEMKNFPPSESEIRRYERELAVAGGCDGAAIMNMIPLGGEQNGM